MIEIKAKKIAEGLIFGEGIRWDAGRVVLSDMLGKKVLRIDPATGVVSELLGVEQQPNGIVVLGENHYLIASMFDARVLEWKNGDVSTYVELDGLVTGYLGDMVMDAYGNLFVDDVGARVLHGEDPALGRLICINQERQCNVVEEGVAFPNGLAISGSGKELYLAETMTSKIWVFDLDEKGVLSGKRELISFSDYSRIDGMTADSNDGIWACMLDQDKVIRVNPEGDKTHAVSIPGFEPIAATIGGHDGQTMFVTAISAIEGKNIFEEMMAGRVSASLFEASIPYAKGACLP